MAKSELSAKIKKTIGPTAYARVRRAGLQADSSVDNARRWMALQLSNRGEKNYTVPVQFRDGLYWQVGVGCLPGEAGERNRSSVTNALTAANVEWWFVNQRQNGSSILGVSATDRERTVETLSQLDREAPGYLIGLESKLVVSAHAGHKEGLLAQDLMIGYFAPYHCSDTTLFYGVRYACEIEFWDFSSELDQADVEAPRENRAARLLSASDAKPSIQDTPIGRVPCPQVLSKTMIDDVTFPIDAVYTWVDGEDPLWLNAKGHREAELSGVEYHEEANHTARFKSRDELKYSLRSLEMYASWFNRIYIVTAGQEPEWLDTDHPQIVLVDHKDIFPPGDYLPTFNSNSIISRLHHIPGLSEHYVYINDDVFFGRELGADRFFLPNGIAKVSPSKNRRPFGPPSSHDEPHVNLTRNMRVLLEQEFGVTISRAIKHTPHPQLKSVHFEMEQKFKASYESTWQSPFRHHHDIVADQLHHYYAQITGKAVPTNLRYNYINILDDQYRGTMQSTLRLRHRDTFCINDAPVEGAVPIPDDEVNEFLEQYFPVKSAFEK